MARLIMSCGPYLWPMLLIWALIGVLTVVSVVRLVFWQRLAGRRAGAGINAVLFWGVVAAVMGYLGQWSGIYKGLMVLRERGLSSPKALWVGIAESSQTTILGLGILLVAGVIWFGLHSWRQWRAAVSRPQSRADDSPASRGLFNSPGWARARAAVARVGLVLVLVGVTGLTGLVLLSQGYLRWGSAFVWPVVGIAALALLVAVVKTASLWRVGGAEPHGLPNGQRLLVFLATTSLGLGLFGFVFEMYLAARRIEADVDGMARYSSTFLIGSSATLVVSMLVAIGIAVVWFALRSATLHVQRAETRLRVEP